MSLRCRPAFRMLFIIRGTLQSVESKRRQSDTLVDTVTLTSGDFVGDELLTWCLDPRWAPHVGSRYLLVPRIHLKSSCASFGFP